MAMLLFVLQAFLLTVSSTITLEIYSQPGCDAATRTQTLPIAPNTCLLKQKLFCGANNQIVRASYNDGACATSPAGIVLIDPNTCLTTRGVSFKALGNCSTPTPNGPTIPTTTAGTGDWIKVDYTTGACGSATKFASLFLMNGVCLDGTIAYCESGIFKSVHWLNSSSCTGVQTSRVVDALTTTCQPGSLTGAPYAELTCNGATASLNTPAASTLSATNVLTTGTYSDSACTSLVAQTYLAVNTCNPSVIPLSQTNTKYTCTSSSTSAVFQEFASAQTCASGSPTSQVTLNSTCLWFQGQYVKFLGCGAPVDLPTSAGAWADVSRFNVLGMLAIAALFFL